MRRTTIWPILALLLLLGSGAGGRVRAADPFTVRGYYVTVTRTPTFGLDAWKKTIDAARADGANLVVLWTAGGFKSKKFPATWGHNKDHENIRKDFVRDLIDYAHKNEIRVLLGFTPFGYDGVNRMSLEHPDWAATGADGKPIKPFGIHSWGRNLCPAQEDVQRFMLEYVREMYLDFYPNADGLLIESSDYAVCHCKRCGAKFFENEFRFVTAVSEMAWKKNANATVVVYPHYFTGAEAPGLGVRGARREFDPRWTVFYTPHSARPDTDLTKKAKGAIWSDDSPALRTPTEIRDAARHARRSGCTGWVPSFEAFTYTPTEPEDGQQYLVGRRQQPLGFGWLKPEQIPYDELPARVNRVAYREYARNPDLSDTDFRTTLGKDLFGAAATPEAVEDALALQRVFVTGRTWWQAAPVASPDRVRAMKTAGQLSAARRTEYWQALDRLREIEQRYRGKEPFSGLYRPAKWAVGEWAGDTRKLLDP
ncbi:Putative lipoprotein yddW OS=Fibrella aestuarina BUZ 2 GN=FAES_5033 PE=4 SV=1: GHL6 [Gemmata massiliana]|uniref:Glycoside hydrolase family 42 N-terminal domain-containing protein n=1 Tax=Gemmata massiliana TaxID=1210884 RepID=A0A6P2D0F7_9BACT|nr:hypothetical protein [Gemmata massiliana]VTR93554.1 Putative lipoprotein yddW OS=Fibrella aestuarina BUZ 2 GN=FAES_5033 PE=4 SV=1: GHL6 [Gemmata massiliana]